MSEEQQLMAVGLFTRHCSYSESRRKSLKHGSRIIPQIIIHSTPDFSAEKQQKFSR